MDEFTKPVWVNSDRKKARAAKQRLVFFVELPSFWTNEQSELIQQNQNGRKTENFEAAIGFLC